MEKIGRALSRRPSSAAATSPPKFALLIGIDYVNAATPAFGRLTRARSDTKAFRDLLIGTSIVSSVFPPSPLQHAIIDGYGYLPENVTMMLDEDGIPAELWPSRENIVRVSRSMTMCV